MENKLWKKICEVEEFCILKYYKEKNTKMYISPSKGSTIMSQVTLSQNKKQCLNEKIKLKQCQFPGCEVKFQGRGLEKYCQEHRKKEYYKQLYHDKYKEKNKESTLEIRKLNQIIKHKNCDCFTIRSICALEGCYKEFKILVEPGNFIYPKFCEEHRNEFKRKMFLERMKRS